MTRYSSAVQIPNLTPATSLNGTEQLEAVQAGSTVRLTVQQIANYAASAASSLIPLYNVTTSQKNALAVSSGVIVFDTDLGKICVYNGSSWETITSV